MRTQYRTWGRGSRLAGDGYAIRRSDEGDTAAVVRSIERRSGLVCCSGPRDEGTSLDNRGRPVDRHYACTLGRRVRGGGFAPVAELWFAIPVQG